MTGGKLRCTRARPGHLDAVLEIESLFAPVELSDRDAEDLKTIDDLAAFIDRELAKARARLFGEE